MAARSAEIIKGAGFAGDANTSRPPFGFDRFMDKRRPLDLRHIPPFRRPIQFNHAYGHMYHHMQQPLQLNNMYTDHRKKFVDGIKKNSRSFYQVEKVHEN